MKFSFRKIILGTTLFTTLISFPSYGANKAIILAEEILPTLKRVSTLPKSFLLENNTEVSKRFLHGSPRYQRKGRYFDSGPGTSWCSSPVLFWAGAVSLSGALGCYLNNDHVTCAPKESEKIRSHWGIPREGYNPRKIQERLGKLIDEERKKGDNRVLVVRGPLGAGKTVLSCDSVWEVREREEFLGHFFHSASDKKALKKQMISFAHYLGMPRNETSYRVARSFIEERLAEPEAKGFVIIFDGACSGKKVNKFLFEKPQLKGLQIVTTQDEKFEDYGEAGGWTYFPVDGLEKEEAVNLLLTGINERKKTSQDVDRKKAEQLIEIIGDTLPFNIMDLVTQINMDEITVDQLILNHQKSNILESIVQARIKRKPSEIKNILYLLSNLSNTEIPIELVEMLNDPSCKAGSSLVMKQLLAEGIVKGVKAEVYEIHPKYQEAAMQAYIDKMKEKRKSDYSSIGSIIGGLSGMGIFGVCGGIVVANTLLSPVAMLMGLGVTVTGYEVIKGIGIGAAAGALPGILVGKQIGMVYEKLSAPSDDTLRKEFLQKMSKSIIEGCSSEQGMQKCRGFLHHLEVISDKCEKAEIEVKDLKHLLKKLKH